MITFERNIEKELERWAKGKYHKTVRTVATVLPKEVDRFVELAQHIKSEMEHERQPKLFPVMNKTRHLVPFKIITQV